MEVIVRHVESRDIPAITQLFTGKNAYSGTLQLPYPSQAMWEKRLSDIPDNMYSLVAEIDGQVVGQAGMEVCVWPRRKHVAQFGMAVHDDYLGQGIGSKLLAALIDMADNWLNVLRIELTVFTDNQPAIALYEKYGFVIEGEAKKYAFRNGNYADIYHMARIKQE